VFNQTCLAYLIMYILWHNSLPFWLIIWTRCPSVFSPTFLLSHRSLQTVGLGLLFCEKNENCAELCTWKFWFVIGIRLAWSSWFAGHGLDSTVLDWGVETVYLGILMIHYNTAVYIIYCLMLLLHSFNTVLHWQNKGMTINNL